MIHKSTYSSGFIKKSTVKAWLRFFINQPLYKMYITVDWSQLDTRYNVRTRSSQTNITITWDIETEQSETVIDKRMRTWIRSALGKTTHYDVEWGALPQHCTRMFIVQKPTPMNIIYNFFAEELLFPSIYYGVAHLFKQDLNKTAYMMSTSEIRWNNHYRIIPQHVLYMTMKILQLRVVNGIHKMFRWIQDTANIMQKQIKPSVCGRICRKETKSNKSLSNSITYWQNHKNDLCNDLSAWETNHVSDNER